MNFLITIFSIQGLAVFLAFFRLISKKTMVHILRFSYSIFLLFSGFVKIIDPLGFSYKLEEYFQVFGMEWLFPFTLFLSILICVVEILIGLFLIYGIYVKQILYANLILMIGFTFLTFYSAYFNAVTDCGCFGDFMKLEPWVSFQKDVFLLIVSCLLLYYQSYIHALSSIFEKNRFLVPLAFLLVIVSIPIYSLMHLPFIDFRAYKIGANLIEGRKNCDEVGEPCLQEEIWYKVVDKKSRDTLQMLSKEWVSKWQEFDKVAGYEERIIIDKGYEPPIKDFDIIHPMDMDQNMTDSILSMSQVFLIISHDIEKTNVDAHNTIRNIFSSITEGSNLQVYGLSSSSQEDVMHKLSISELLYPYFLVDQTTLKTIIRSNPGIIMLEKGVVRNKWHWRDFPQDLSSIIN